MMKKHYTMKRRGSKYAGYDVFCCNHCPHETHLFDRMMIHMEAFHPEALIDDEEVIESLSGLTKAELIEKAKQNGVAIRGSKAELEERLIEAGVEL